MSRYIHLNPLAAKITKSLESYLWSSYPDYINKENRTPWLKVDEVRLMLNASNRRLAYAKFVAVGVDQETREFYEKKNMPVILGSKVFKGKILECIEKEQLKSSQSDYNKTKNLPSMSDVEQMCAHYFKIDKEHLHILYKKGNEARKTAIYGSRVWAKEKLSVIADFYHCQSHSSVSNAVKSIKVKIEHDAKFRDEINKIYSTLLA